MIYLIFLISIFFHEIAHILIGSFLGHKIKKIKMLPIGFYIEYKNYGKISFFSNLIVLFSGPLCNVILCIIFFNIKIKISEEILLTNIFLAIFNLLPIYPLDGENILEICLKKIYGYEKGLKFSFFISKTLLCAFTFLYSLIIVKVKNISILFCILFLWYKNFEKERQINFIQKAYKVIEKSII